MCWKRRSVGWPVPFNRAGNSIIEPWLERQTDFSVQLEMAPDGFRLCGYTGLINDLRGQFQANWADGHPATATRSS